MATSRATFRPLVGQECGMGSFLSLTTTSSGSTTTAVCTGLKAYGDSHFEYWWLVLPTGYDGLHTYEVQQVQSGGFTQSTGTLTVATAFAGTVGSGVTFELYRYDPRIIHQALSAALIDVFKDNGLAVQKRDETLLVDNRLSNSDFETFASTFTGWTNAGAGVTVTQETTIVWHGTGSAKIVSGGAAAGQMTQTLTLPINELIGKAVNFKMKVYATAADTARIRIDWDGGTTFTNSDYHSAEDQWETLEINATVPSGATQVKFILESAISGTSYFDAGGATVGPKLVKYTIPTAITKGPYLLSVQDDFEHSDGSYSPVTDFDVQEDSGGRYIILNEWLSSLQRLRIEGIGSLTDFTSTDTSTTEVDAPRTRLVVLKAAQIVCQRLYIETAGQDRDKYLQNANILEAQYKQSLEAPNLRQLRKPAAARMNWEYG